MSAETKPFETARTKELLTRDLDERDLKCVKDVEEFGCHVIQVSGSDQRKAWTYTVGGFDTTGRSEIVVVGLENETAASAVNNAVRALRDGTDLSLGCHRELVGEVEVVFRSVDPIWVKELMGWAKWFQGDWNFPVLQLIYPDLEGRFQWEDSFNEYFRQPLLQADAPQTDVEHDFKLSANPDSSLSDWAFPDGPHTAAYLSKTVHDGEEAVTCVSHDADGDWQFLGDLMSKGGGPVLSCLHHAIDKDSTLKELANLPLGWVAEREAVGKPWVRSEHGPKEQG